MNSLTVTPLVLALVMVGPAAWAAAPAGSTAAPPRAGTAAAGVAAPAAARPDWAAAHAETAQILGDLVRIDTSNPPGNETRAAEWVKARLAKDGIESVIYESAPGRGNLVARLKGSGRRRPLVIMGHLDVVGVERDKWTVDPFAALVKDGELYGRGASDDKGMDAANLEVFLLLHRLKVPLDRDVILVAEAGEEGTSQYGIDFLVDKHWDAIDCEYALNEGGDAELVDGSPIDMGVSTTEKVPRGLKLVAHGSSGHGSMPRMDNAVVHLAAAVGKVGSWQPPMRLNETTRAYFERLATISTPENARLYTHLDDPAVQQTLRETQIRQNSMLRTSISATIIKGGFRENVIPADAEATLDVRALPDEDMGAFVAELKRIIDDPEVQIVPLEGGQARPVTPPSRLDTEMFHALETAQKLVYPRSITLPLMQTGATDSAQLRAKGVQAYGIAIPRTEEDLRRVHGNDERVSLEELGRFTEYLYAAVVDVAAAK
jgi:acetylornithine deacetylase/succinyl-diaminopimelate desuccinylase-like protein